MTLQELYARIGGDYTEAVGRLRAERLIDRFIVRFLDDTSCRDLIAAWERGDEDAAFKAAHTAKGVCANLSLTTLGELATQICEALRPGNDELRARTNVSALVAELEIAYDDAVEVIKSYQASR